MDKPLYTSITFRADLEQEDQLHGFMLMNSTLEGVEESAEGLITFFIPIEEWNEAFKQQLEQFLAGLPKNSVTLVSNAELENKDWNAEWENSIEPQRITDSLVISPSWRLAEAEQMAAKYLIKIDPKMSFGTGHHETTRLCLRAVETVDVQGKTILDIGTGSGVLAIYALLRGAISAVAIDTDPWSIDNTIENRELNGIGQEQLDVRFGELEKTVEATEHFDIIFANIHRNVLIAIRDAIRERLNNQGIVILSGILIYDAEEVASAYLSRGYDLLSQLQENEWVSLVLQKKQGYQ